jgi:tetratricopeptide (TPR) repeat protein
MDVMQQVMWPQFMKAKCYGTRGFILLREGNHRAAIDDYTVSLDIVPHGGNFEQRAEAYDAVGEHALAASDRRSARTVEVAGSLRRARIAWHDDRHREALAELNRVLELEPAHATALFRRAMVLWELKLMEEAERDLSRAIELRPEDRYLYLRRSEVRAIRGEREGARSDRERCHELGLDLIAYYDEFLERHRRDVVRGNAALVQKSVIPTLTFLLKMIPEHLKARELRAQAFESVGNARRAAQDRKMLQLMEALPAAVPAPDDTPFGRWFWDMMDRDP